MIDAPQRWGRVLFVFTRFRVPRGMEGTANYTTQTSWPCDPGGPPFLPPGSLHPWQAPRWIVEIVNTHTKVERDAREVRCVGWDEVAAHGAMEHRYGAVLNLQGTQVTFQRF